MADESGSSAVVETIAQAAAGQAATESVGQTDATVTQVEGAPAAPEPLDADYVSRAKAFSLSEDELRSIPRETVERMIASSDRAFINSARQDYAPQAPPPQQPPPQRRENGQFAAAPTDFSYEPWKPQFDDDADVAEPIVKNMTSMEQHVAKQFERLHQHYAAKLQAQEQFQNDAIVQKNNATVDRFVDGQGAEWGEVFGKGSTNEMNPQSQEFLNRVEVWTAANAMVNRSASNGRRMTINEALPRARNAMFMEKAFAIERAKANGKRTQLEAGATDRSRTPGGVPVPMTIKDKARLMREASIRA